MVTVRIRSMIWFTTGIALALALLVSWSTWRAEALPSAEESTIVNVTPTRILDSRDPTDVGLAGPFVSPVAQKLRVTGMIPTAEGMKTVVPTGATGVLLNVTVVSPSADGFVSIRPGDAVGVPTTSSLNFAAGQTVPNSAQVALPTVGSGAGQIDIVYSAFGASGPTSDVLIDVVGYTKSSGLQEINSALGTKADSADVYTKAEVDEAIANRTPIAVSVADTDVADPPANTYGVIMTASITVPVAGVIQIDGSVFVASGATAPVEFSCLLTDGAGETSNLSTDDLDETDRHTTIYGANDNGSCATNGATSVAAGTHVVNLVARRSAADGALDDATLDLLFVPGSASSFTSSRGAGPEVGYDAAAE